MVMLVISVALNKFNYACCSVYRFAVFFFSGVISHGAVLEENKIRLLL